MFTVWINSITCNCFLLNWLLEVACHTFAFGWDVVIYMRGSILCSSKFSVWFSHCAPTRSPFMCFLFDPKLTFWNINGDWRSVYVILEFGRASTSPTNPWGNRLMPVNSLKEHHKSRMPISLWCCTPLAKLFVLNRVFFSIFLKFCFKEASR